MHRGLIFVKTHKTGGTTVANILLRLAIEMNITCCLAPVHRNSGFTCQRPPVNIKESSLFAQHVVYSPSLLHRVTPRPAVLITIMRTPAAQATSAFLYGPWQKILKRFGSSHWKDHLRRIDTPSSEKRVDSCLYMNYQSRDMGYSNSVHDTLASYDLIMVLEHLDKSLILMHEVLKRAGWPISLHHLSFKHLNSQKPSGVYNTSRMQEQVSLLYGVSIDTIVYKLALQQLHRMWNRNVQAHTDLLTRFRKISSCANCRSDNMGLMTKCARRRMH